MQREKSSLQKVRPQTKFLVFDTKAIGQRLEKWRKANGVSMRQIGQVMATKGIEENYITLYKRAKRFMDGNPAMRLDQLNKICEFTGKSVDYFVTGLSPAKRIEAALEELGVSDTNTEKILQEVEKASE